MSGAGCRLTGSWGLRPHRGAQEGGWQGPGPLQKGSSSESQSAPEWRGHWPRHPGGGSGRGLKGPTAPARFTGRAGVLPTLSPGPRLPTHRWASSRSPLPSPRGAEFPTTRRPAAQHRPRRAGQSASWVSVLLWSPPAPNPRIRSGEAFRVPVCACGDSQAVAPWGIQSHCKSGA